MLVGIVIAITLMVQDTTPQHRDTTPPAPPAPTVEQIRYMDGLKTVMRGVAQIRNGIDRVVRTQHADSVTRRRAARRLGGLCGTARSFIVSGRPRMQPTAYSDSLKILAKQLTMRLDSLTGALPACERTAGRDPTGVTTTLTTRLKNYDDALLTFRAAQAALYKPDSAKAQAIQ